MTDIPAMVGGIRARTQGADFSMLAPLARRLGVTFDDAAPPAHLTLSGAHGIKLHALDWRGDGLPVLFLHGGGLTARTWDCVNLGLRRFVRGIALDLRGHGDSDRAADYSVDLGIADVAHVLDALGWRKAHLVGMSFGGLIAAHFAASAPHRVSSLVMVDVGPGVVFEATRRMREFFQRVDPRDGPEAMVAAAMRTSPRSDRERVAYRMMALMRRDESGAWRWARDRLIHSDYPALLAKVEQLTGAAARLDAPCLVIRGGRSKVFPSDAARRFAACFANGALTTVPDAGHNVQEDNPAGLIAALLEFWSRVRQTPRC